MSELPENLRGDGPCGDCGTPDNIVWHAENVLWNAVMSFPNPPSHGDPGGIICIPCFVKRVQVAGLKPVGWTLTADWPWRWTPEGYATVMAMQEKALAAPPEATYVNVLTDPESIALLKRSIEAALTAAFGSITADQLAIFRETFAATVDMELKEVPDAGAV